ncbi:hypothetical protein AtNW77_Chr4g0310701 [Arabidopsis thaliana]|uniref:Beta-1,3-N-Acetylglucosaminyltransferase family protein n=4 Tax=Arabidopsis TaxID=3701 RepID=F4JTI5_ARATH|nr:Beta-1,3-N-Acetylglucosaminyltransferase family protein [Arabidopsis thaliana]KAG7618103.1 hypothetical protein ISN45_At04g034030 [Arabidopsis thaliana x Arabidopsis arenosa]KAG7622567.1 hypothetical protein ISN44_As04g033480 [Arabidopsis suecica]AEE86005.1 Beta-1,3-N-Acetylglucosaminyltransferase family protein [Arabidopsis thaliana]OAO96997.1 hypothetical protein AXX17_AT4G36760 [Arabidopsis thaliana]CAA0397205.1 unnamed protein product [Arabidopsis thaliana]|eukprot:NP_194938.4 Beta-1,3-N-Acetylglucosaminyltransferase family protein [Arabidopsis thaliana]
MATNACKFLCLVLLFAFVTQGYGDDSYSLESLSVIQSKTGNMVENKPEWEVKVLNSSPCYFTHTTLSCVRFKSVTPIDSKVLSKSGDTCLLGNGDSIHDISFKYVWDTSFDLKVVDGYIACS